MPDNDDAPLIVYYAGCMPSMDGAVYLYGFQIINRDTDGGDCDGPDSATVESCATNVSNEAS